MRPTPSILSRLLLPVFLLGCQPEEVVTAQLTLAQIQRGDVYALSGFACTTSDGRPAVMQSEALGARAFTASETQQGAVVVNATLVLDYIRLGGYPRCRANTILNYCAEEGRDCVPMASERVCIDLEPLTISVETLQQLTELKRNGSSLFADFVRERVSGSVVTSGAPDEEAILRLVGTTETCAQIEARGGLDFDTDKLLGCSYSCPLVPSAARGEILLDFEGVGRCENDVIRCASERFAPREQGELPDVPTR